MKREEYSCRVVKTTLNVTQGKIDSVRKNDITRTGCRVYENGKIGISGCFGEPTEENWKAAQENLKLAIPYPYKTGAHCERTEDRREECLNEKEFLEKSEAMLEKLQKENPDFIFSNKLIATQVTEKLQNDEALRYENSDNAYVFSIIFKHEDSKSVFDGAFGMQSRTFDGERFVNDCNRVLKAYRCEVPMPQEKVLPVICSLESVGEKIAQALSGEALGKKTSIFSDKLEKKVFSENFTLYVDRTARSIETPFFDAEGSTMPGDKTALIENGVIRRGFCDKKNAAEFGFENTAGAEGGTDDVPSLAVPQMSVEPSGKTYRELIGTGRAIYIDMMSGGDCTADGNFASPVQLAYLVEDGELKGRLPEFNISGNIYEMFGKDYIGLSSDKPFFGEHALILNMKLD